jgi:flagellar biosynthesis protein FlhF
MRLRTFTAPDMPTAMKMVRDTLGDGAIILSTDSAKGKRNVTVTAAVDTSDEPALAPRKVVAKIRDSVKIDDLRHEIQNVLRFHNIPELFVSKMVRFASDDVLESVFGLERLSARKDEKNLLAIALEKIAENYFRFDPLITDGTPLRIMLVGTPGIGKTLTIAKIAALISINAKQPKSSNLAVITTDSKRAGGVEQLQAFTDILGLTLHTAKNAKDIQDFIHSLPKSTHVLIDTAGCNPYEYTELSQLKTFAQIKGIEPVLVMPAGGDSLEAIDMIENFTSMPIKRMLVTRADTARRFGGILAAAAAHGLALCNISGSAGIVDGLQPANGTLLTQLLLRYQNN